MIRRLVVVLALAAVGVVATPGGAPAKNVCVMLRALERGPATVGGRPVFQATPDDWAACGVSPTAVVADPQVAG